MIGNVKYEKIIVKKRNGKLWNYRLLKLGSFVKGKIRQKIKWLKEHY